MEYIKGMTFRYIFLIIILAAGILLGFLTLKTPDPYEGTDETAFSAAKVKETINEIAKEPRPFNSEANRRVCAYLCDQLAALGLKPVYPNTGEPYVVTTDGYRNIAAILDGESDNAILLTAHYDSSRKSYGAADDGYGVATILEILRAIRAQDVPLLNDIMVLFTDGEELGMEGAGAELGNNLETYKNVLFVISVEANGMNGPPVMFETSDRNAAVIDFFAKYAMNPVAYSFTSAYYKFMPKNTDFSIFRDYGFKGINIAVLDGYEYHHTPEDNPRNIDIRSLQHYGDQVFPVVKGFVSDPSVSHARFASNQNKVFFTIFPGVLMTYSNNASILMGAVAALLFIAVFTAGCSKRRIRPGRTVLYAVLLLASVIVLSAASQGIAWLLSRIYRRRFRLVNMADIPHADLYYLLVNIAAVILLGIICRKLAKRNGRLEIVFAGAMMNLVLSAILLGYLEEVAYIAILPSMLGVLYTLIASIPVKPGFIAILSALAAVLDLIIYIPVVVLVYHGLTIWAMGAGVLFCLLPFTTILPMLYAWLYTDCENDRARARQR